MFKLEISGVQGQRLFKASHVQARGASRKQMSPSFCHRIGQDAGTIGFQHFNKTSAQPQLCRKYSASPSPRLLS